MAKGIIAILNETAPVIPSPTLSQPAPLLKYGLFLGIGLLLLFLLLFRFLKVEQEEDVILMTPKIEWVE